MRAEERIARLEAENAWLREQISQLLGYVAENAALREQVSQLLLQLAELKGRPAKEVNTRQHKRRAFPGRKLTMLTRMRNGYERFNWRTNRFLMALRAGWSTQV